MESSQNLWQQKIFSLKSYKRGCHLITDEVLNNCPEISKYKIGLFTLLLKHTSASICINNCEDPNVKTYMEEALNKVVPEDTKLYRHTMEGKDDMPAHIKSALIGTNLTIPIREGKLELGKDQGIWLCEHRDGTHTRTLVATLNGVSN